MRALLMVMTLLLVTKQKPPLTWLSQLHNHCYTSNLIIIQNIEHIFSCMLGFFFWGGGVTPDSAMLFTLISNKNPLFIFYPCCCSVAWSCLTLCDPMDCSTPGFPVLHHLPGLAQTHVHRVGDAIQLSHPLLSPSPPAFNLSQHQGLF